jgi:hypothetical protein
MSEPFDERRESQRVPCRFQVRETALGGSFVEHDGNLALGGVYYAELHPPVGAVVEVRFILPGQSEEVMARGEVIRVSREGDLFGTHLRFTDIPLGSELALARFLQGRADS